MRSTIFTTLLIAESILAAPTTGWTVPADFEKYTKGFKDPTIQSSVGGSAICISGTIDVTASANNTHYKLKAPASQVELTGIVAELAQINSTYAASIAGEPNPVTGTYGIYAQFCIPSATGAVNTSTLQFLVHGGGFTGTYWDNAPGYSYVDFAAEQGYSVFLYDRLGTGQSERPDGIQVVQTALNVAIAHELLTLVRSGAVAGQAFDRVVGVGHSYGSIQLYAVTVEHPADFDALVLTGFSAAGDGLVLNTIGQGPAIAAVDSPQRFAGLSNAYIVPGPVQGLQYGFFRWPGFDPKLLDLAFLQKDTQGLGEAIGLTADVPPAKDFTGAMFVVNGENDVPACAGYCLYPSNQVSVVKEVLFPQASNGSGWYLVPDTGHGVNYHYGAAEAYEKIQCFLRANGL